LHIAPVRCGLFRPCCVHEIFASSAFPCFLTGLACALVINHSRVKQGFGKLTLPRILVAGNPTLDELVDRGNVTVRPGGTALFASCAAAFLGSRVGILGCIGQDYPDATLKSLKALHVDIGDLAKASGRSTRFRISRFNGSRRLQLIEPGHSVEPRSNLVPVQSIHLGPVFNEISSSLVKTLRRKCDFLSADLQGFIRKSTNTGLVHLVRRRIGGLLNQCDLVQASLDEAQSQLQLRSPTKIARKLLRHGVHFAILTMGKRGSWLVTRSEGLHRIPAYSDSGIRDSTGAGDVFAGSWLSTYLSTRDPVWSSAVGSAFASLASRKTGISKFHMSRGELLRRAGWVYNRVEASAIY
jgi:sugar/nucleoside kinase (ribokinase family)